VTIVAAGATQTRPLVSIHNVSKQFANGTLAIRGVDLDLHDGEFVSLLGPSGCGKSTLLRIIARLGSPSAGTIEWPTAPHSASGEPEPDLGFVFQDPTLMPWSNTLRNVMLPMTLAGVSKADAEARAAEMLALVGLKGFEKSYPRELSGGMKMRVSIARALVIRPKILLMDEPFAALDALTRETMQHELLRIAAAAGTTVIFITHQIDESVFLGDRVAVFATRPGRLQEIIPIDPPRPRPPGIKQSPEFQIHVARIVRLIGTYEGHP